MPNAGRSAWAAAEAEALHTVEFDTRLLDRWTVDVDWASVVDFPVHRRSGQEEQEERAVRLPLDSPVSSKGLRLLVASLADGVAAAHGSQPALSVPSRVAGCAEGSPPSVPAPTQPLARQPNPASPGSQPELRDNTADK